MSDYLDTEDSDNEDASAVKESLSESEKEELLQRCAALKVEGNSLYSQGNFEGALEKYTQGINAVKSSGLPHDALLLLNRCATYIALKRYVPALNDANIAIEVDPSNWKGHWRKGVALMSMSKRTFRTTQAIAAFEDCARCESFPAAKRAELQSELAKANTRREQQEADTPPPDLSKCVPS